MTHSDEDKKESQQIVTNYPYDIELVEFLSEQIKARALKYETPSMRLIQITIIMTIIFLQRKQKIVTARHIREFHGLTSQHIHLVLRNLEDKGLIDRVKSPERIKGTWGKNIIFRLPKKIKEKHSLL
jgi:DNA-binding MarR family transcriptional regulator